MFNRKQNSNSVASDNVPNIKKTNLTLVPNLDSEHQTASNATKFDKSLQESVIISLSDRDWKFIHDTMDNPPDPSPKLRNAFNKYLKANA